MYLTLFFAVAAGGCATYAWNCKRKYRKAKSEQIRLNNEFIASERECLSQKEIIKSLEERLHEHKHLLTAGGRNLKIRQWRIPFNCDCDTHGVVSVVGCDTRRSDLHFVIKSYLYDENDPDGYDFAMREAEELIERLQER